MKKRSNRVAFFSVILLVVLTMLAGSGSVFGNEIEDKRRSVEQKQQEIEQKTQEEQRLEQEKATAEQNKASYRKQVEELNGQVLSLQQQQQTVQEAITAGEARLKDLLEQKKAYEQGMKKRIQFLYEDGRSSLAATLLSAQSVSEFINRFDYIADMSEYDRGQMIAYQKVSAVIEEERTALSEKQTELEALAADTQNTLASYETLAAEAERTVVASEQQQGELSKEKQTLSNELAGEQADLDKLVAEAKAAEEAHAAAVEAARKAQEEAVRQAQEEAARKAQEEAAKQAQEEADKKAREEASKQAEDSNQSSEEQSGSTKKPDDTAKEKPSTPPAPVVPQHSGSYSYTEDELNKLTAIVYCEAGGEPYVGQVAVASVILNRVDSSLFSNSIEGVILAPYQFSPTIDYTGRGSRYQLILKDVIANPGKYQSVRNASLAALAGEKPVGSFLFFHTIQLGSELGGVVIGNHVFYEVWVQHDYN